MKIQIHLIEVLNGTEKNQVKNSFRELVKSKRLHLFYLKTYESTEESYTNY